MDFNASHYQELLEWLRDAIVARDEAKLRALLSNNLNTILAALAFAADRAP